MGQSRHGLCKTLGMTRTPVPSPDDERWDVQRRFIRIVHEHANGMVEFEFAVGEPGMFAEMILPRAEFEDFCRTQGVQPTHGALPAAADGSAQGEWDWSLRDARDRHFRHEP